MEKEEIIVLDEGMELSPVSPESFCCGVVYLPYYY
jgi:hypothetical protein